MIGVNVSLEDKFSLYDFNNDNPVTSSVDLIYYRDDDVSRNNSYNKM